MNSDLTTLALSVMNAANAYFFGLKHFDYMFLWQKSFNKQLLKR